MNTTGDEAFSETVENHWKSIFQLGLRMFGNSTDAEEATQQTFFQADPDLWQWWDEELNNVPQSKKGTESKGTQSRSIK